LRFINIVRQPKYQKKEVKVENIVPDTFLNFVASIALLVSVLCLLVTFIESKKAHATRIFSILMVASLALFSSYWVTYFAAIFIIATAVTELEFLQNLAAILRKDQNYFNYKKEALTKEENKKRIQIEAVEDEVAVLETPDEEGNVHSEVIKLAELQGLSRSQSMKLFYEIEEKTVNYLKGLYPAIESGIRIRKNGILIELDAIVTGHKNSPSKIFEIKWVKNEKNTHSLLWHTLRQAKDVISKYRDITGLDAELVVVVVVNTEASIGSGSIDDVRKKADLEGISLHQVHLSKLGYQIEE
jgi:hypothetical protein